MGEIAQLLQQKAGLSDEQSQQAESAVIEFVKSRVPEQFQGMLGTVLGAEQGGAAGGADASAGGSGELGSLLGAAESLFGENKG
jgi:hypothetical protein